MKPLNAFEQSISHSIAASRAESQRSKLHRRAFVVEAVLLAFFLAVSLAVVVSVFGSAVSAGRQAQELSVATMLAGGGASNGAEDFAANPDQAKESSVTHYVFSNGVIEPLAVPEEGAFKVERFVSKRQTGAGVIYRADITVSRGGREVYKVSTSAYVSERGE